jgi:hypothetical protein
MIDPVYKPCLEADDEDDLYLVRCECGEEGLVRAADLLSGAIRSCPRCAAKETPRLH